MDTRERVARLNAALAHVSLAQIPKTPEFIAGMLANRCYRDEEFRRQFIADPTAALREQGVDIPAGVAIVVKQNDERVWHVPAPSDAMVKKLSLAELSDAQIDGITGGTADKVSAIDAIASYGGPSAVAKAAASVIAASMRRKGGAGA